MIRPQKLNAEEIIPVVQKEYSKVELIEKVYKYSEKHDVSSKLMIDIINCENINWDPTLQSGLKYKEGNRWGFKAGTQEKSYGLVQIHLPDNKEVTLEEATDTDFALDFMASNIAKGRARMWSCYKNNP